MLIRIKKLDMPPLVIICSMSGVLIAIIYIVMFFIQMFNINTLEMPFTAYLLIFPLNYILCSIRAVIDIFKKYKEKDLKPKEYKNKFLNTYHIQGTDNSTIYLGLYYKNILVSVMTFSNSRMGIGKRKKVSNVYELVRYATNSNFIVIGGFGKLLKYFEDKYKPTELYSYADLRWCDKDNNIYIKNNFVLSHINRPNYWYCYGKKRYHRTAFMKCNLKNKFPDLYDESLSEKEIMSKTAFFRVYDCGTAVFIKKY